MGSKLHFSSSHHSQTDGQTEVVNWSLRNLMRSLVREHPKQWDLTLAQAEFAFNSSVNRITGDSVNKGNFLELLHWLARHSENIGHVVLKNAPKNSKITCSSIQKNIVSAAATEVEKAIAKEIGGDFFFILVDESCGVSCKEQMSLVLSFVNNEGVVIERFVGIKQVNDTSALSLKSAIYSMLLGHGLSPCIIRGQGFDGASNMSGAFNGMKTLIMRESESAHVIHCFAHQLQLALVFVAKNHCSINEFFQ
ncbi:uncharacterized protein [Rutidosis leptorrhynchoides]|uniref:uncharacterized protein n=1 Tax=Rutidosis leptorrhynchoides TaxID=125765 RepID=UPI003A996A6A